MAGARTTVTTTEVSEDFPRIRRLAQASEIVEVAEGDSIVGGFLSATALADYQRLKRRQSESLVVGELPDDVVEVLAAAEYGKIPD